MGRRSPQRSPGGRPLASEHRNQADLAGMELAGHRLGSAQRHQAGLLDGPAPATEVQGEMGRAAKQKELEPGGAVWGTSLPEGVRSTDI